MLELIIGQYPLKGDLLTNANKKGILYLPNKWQNLDIFSSFEHFYLYLCLESKEGKFFNYLMISPNRIDDKDSSFIYRAYEISLKRDKIGLYFELPGEIKDIFSSECVFLGCGDYIELWRKSDYSLYLN